MLLSLKYERAHLRGEVKALKDFSSQMLESHWGPQFSVEGLESILNVQLLFLVYSCLHI